MATSKYLNAVVDTGTFLHEPDLLRRIFATQSDVRLWVSVLNLVDAVAEIRDEDSFLFAQAHMKLVHDIIGANILPVPDTLFRKSFGLDLPEDARNIWEWLPHVINSERNYREALEGKDIGGTGQRINVKYVRGWQERYLKTLEGYCRSVILGLKPQGIGRDGSWSVKMMPAEMLAVRKLFANPYGDKALLDPFLMNMGLKPDDMGEDEYQKAYSMLMFFIKGYQGFLLRLFESGKKPRPTDHIDLHLLLPLWQTDWVLLTEDRDLVDALRRGGVPVNKYCSAESLLR